MNKKFLKWIDALKWIDGIAPENQRFAALGWDSAINEVLKKAKSMRKRCEGFYQHEDIDYLIEDIKELKNSQK